MPNKPMPSGQYAVGTFTYTVYNDRDDINYPGTKRCISARVYYPVLKESVDGFKKAEYMSREMASAFRKTYHLSKRFEDQRDSEDNSSECFVNAPRIDGVKFPLVVFSHGLSSYRESNSFMCLEIASHGYIVISLAHPHEAILAEFDDGTSVSFDKALIKKQYEPFLPGVSKLMKLMKMKGSERELAEKFDAFQKKYSKCFMGRIAEWEKDTVAAVNYAKENLSDLIDFSCGIAVTGHSFGGATAYALCLDHPEFVCGINIDGALFGDNWGKVLEKPFLQIGCKKNSNAEVRPLIDHSDVVYKAVFNDMEHAGFSDLKFVMNVKYMVGKLDANVLHENLCKCHLEFYDAYLKKTKDKPSFTTNEAVTFTEYSPDIK